MTAWFVHPDGAEMSVFGAVRSILTPDTVADWPLSARSLTDAVARSLDGLHAREAKILRLYFGLDGDDALTLDEIGDRLGITRERVRQIKERALSRLRRRAGTRSLETFAR